MVSEKSRFTATPQVADELREVLRQDLAIDTDRLARDDRLIEDLGLDSVAFAIALVAIEDSTGVRLSEEALTRCHTVGDIDDLLAAQLESQRAATR